MDNDGLHWSVNWCGTAQIVAGRWKTVPMRSRLSRKYPLLDSGGKPWERAPQPRILDHESHPIPILQFAVTCRPRRGPPGNSVRPRNSQTVGMLLTHQTARRPRDCRVCLFNSHHCPSSFRVLSFPVLQYVIRAKSAESTRRAAVRWVL